MADIVCPQCGRRVLGVATRCPHCGEGFPQHLLQHPGSSARARTTRVAFLLAGAALVLGLVRLAGRLGAGPGTGAAPPATLEDSAPRPPAAGTLATPPDATPSFTAPAPLTAPPSSPSPALRRYARTWVNLRSARSGGAPGLRVLSPGDAVLVDSLRRGWYRVLVNGRPQGYVDRTYLDTIPPPDRP